MNTTLFIETSGPYCSLALRAEGEDFVENRKLDRTHNQHVLDMLDTTIQSAKQSKELILRTTCEETKPFTESDVGLIFK